MEHEIFVDVRGYEGLYKCSNLGRFFSVKSNKFIKGYVHKTKPYIRIHLWKGGKDRNFSNAGSVILDSFQHKPQDERNQYQCAHVDGNPKNNHLSNLSWVTCKENISHKREHGTQVKKLNESQVINIKKMIQNGLKNQEICTLFNVTPSCISAIKTKKSWSWLK